jgi:hypothetical protein
MVLLKWGAIPPPEWATLCLPAAWPAVDPGGIPRPVADRLAGPVLDLTALGFRAVGHIRVPLLEAFRWLYGVLLISPDGRSGAAVADQRMAPNVPAETFSALGSWFDDGTCLSTRNEPRRINPGPGLVWEHYPCARADELMVRHQKHLDRLTADGRTAIRFSDAGLMEASMAHDTLLFENMLDRGVLIEMTDDEVDDNRRRFRKPAGPD